MSQAEMLIRNGADKLVINSSIYKNSKLIRTITNLFGSQVLVSIDYRIVNGKPPFY